MAYVTPAGGAKGFVVGQNCPAASASIDNYYVIVTVGGPLSPPGASGPAGSGDWFICQAESGTVPVWFLIDYENISVAAENVSLQTIPGVFATNVQTGLEQVQFNVTQRARNITSTVGLDVVATAEKDFTINLKTATATDLGGIYIIPNRGLLLGSDGGVSLLPPTIDGLQIGGVKAGQNITIDPDGTINGQAGGGGEAVEVEVTPIPGIEFATNVQRALEALELQAQDRVEFVKADSVGLKISVSDPGPTSNDGTTALIALDFATTGQKGIVQLTNSVTGSSQDLAVTQFGVNALNAKVDALTGANVLAGTYNCNTGTVVSVTPAGTKAGFTIGAQAPAAASVPDNYYLIVVVGGGFGPPGAVIPPLGVQSGDWFINENEQGAGAAWVTIDFENRVITAEQVNLSPVPGLSATTVQQGISQIQTEIQSTVTSVATLNDGIFVDTAPANAAFGLAVSLRLNPGTATDIGGVFVAANNGLNLTAAGGLSLAPASATTIGGVKAGNNITIDPDGTINATAATAVSIVGIDSIASQFDGTNANFLLLTNSVNLGGSATTLSLFLEVGGVLQPPVQGYTYDPATSTVTFTSAPPAGATFSGRALVGA
jgi:hypothetical protein